MLLSPSSMTPRLTDLVSKLRGAIALVAFAVAAGCLSPTLPLPPPEEPDAMSLVDEGEWAVTGLCLEGAEVVVLNEETGRGAVFVDLDRTGVYSVVVDADECDVIVISQSRGDEASGETRVVLQETVNGVAVDPGACQ